MSIEQRIWSMEKKSMLAPAAILEKDLEDLVCSNIDILSEDWLVIGRQVSTDGGPLDVLCVERGGGLVLVELKRAQTPREIVAQALDYASCITKLTTADSSEIYKIFADYSSKYLNNKKLDDAYFEKFKMKLDPDQLLDSTNPLKVVLVATELDQKSERILSFLRERLNGIVMNILFFKVYEHAGETLLSRAWLYDLTEPDVDNKNSYLPEWNKETYVSYVDDECMSWEDAVKYGFVGACGGPWYSRTLNNLNEDDRIWVNIPKTGYVGVGRVVGPCVPAEKFIVDGKSFYDLELKGKYTPDEKGKPTEMFVVPIKWEHTVDVKNAFLETGLFGNQNTVVKSRHNKWNHTVDRLKQVWGIKD